MTVKACAWCSRSLEPRGAALDPAAKVTHGLCWPCADRQHAESRLPAPAWVNPPDGYATWAEWRGEAQAWPPVVAGGQGRDADSVRHDALGMWLCVGAVAAGTLAWYCMT